MSQLSLVVLQMGGGGQMGNGMGPGGWGFGYGLVGLTVMLLVLGAVGYVFMRPFGGRGRADGGQVYGDQVHGDRTRTDGRAETAADGRATGDEDPALAELRERYARGEVDDEEFERRAQRLRNDVSDSR